MICRRALGLLVLACVALAVLMVGCGGEPSPTATPQPATQTPAPALAPTDPPPTEPSPTAPPPVATSAPPATATYTPTPTPQPAMAVPTATSAPDNDCPGLSGTLEIQILVGPAEVAGLEPVAVGSVPLATSGCSDVCEVLGQGPINYEAVLTKAWGTYEVTMNMDLSVSGTCSGPKGAESLALTIEMSGEQVVVVKATGFSGEYPWSGTQSREVVLPLQEGASAMGEGWGVVLHLGS